MLLRLNNLTESLNERYKIEEKFSDSMPKWLGDRIAYTIKEYGIPSHFKTISSSTDRFTGDGVTTEFKVKHEPIAQDNWHDYGAMRGVRIFEPSTQAWKDVTVEYGMSDPDPDKIIWRCTNSMRSDPSNYIFEFGTPPEKGAKIEISYYYKKGDEGKPDLSNQKDSTVQYKRTQGLARGDLALGPAFLRAGIDISSVNVIEAPIPAHVPKITKNQQWIPIFLMSNGQVWAKGINDEEYYNPPTGDKWSGRKSGKPFKSWNGDVIIDNCVAYAYMELSDPAMGAVTKKRDLRKQLKDELSKIPYYERKNEYGRDASGYQIERSGGVAIYPLPDIADKLPYDNRADEVTKRSAPRKLKEMNDVMDSISNRVNSYHDILSDILLSADLTDYSFMTSIGNGVASLRDASNNLEDGILNARKYAQDMERVFYKNNAMSSFKSAEAHLSNLKWLDEYEKAFVDWQ